MKYRDLSILLIVLILFSFLTGIAFGYFDHQTPKGKQIPVTILPELEEAEVLPGEETGEGGFFVQIPVVLLEQDESSRQPAAEDGEEREQKMTAPSAAPTDIPAEVPTTAPTSAPTLIPTATATEMPTAAATEVPTATATEIPTATATQIPTATATELPTATATQIPTATATEVPTAAATQIPTATATEVPAAAATEVPTAAPTQTPTAAVRQETEEFYPDINAELESAEEHFAEYSRKERADAEKLLMTADDRIFLRKGYTWDFSEAQGYVNEILEPGIIHQWYIYYGKGSDVLMSMSPAAAGLRTGNQRLDLTKGLEDEFHATFSMQRTEDMPEDAGGRCWMRYDNSVQKGDLSEAGVYLFPGYKAIAYKTEAGVRTYRAIADLSGLDQDDVLKFDFIRMDGVCYFYANGDFLFSYEDQIPGSVSFEGGSEIFKGGNRVHCEFDDFAMTYR